MVCKFGLAFTNTLVPTREAAIHVAFSFKSNHVYFRSLQPIFYLHADWRICQLAQNISAKKKVVDLYVKPVYVAKRSLK